jgi:hypothetical protein
MIEIPSFCMTRQGIEGIYVEKGIKGVALF